jgi:hypothetical protein
MRFLCLALIVFASCQATRLNKECSISVDEIRYNWDTTAPSKWNYSCLGFLDRIYSNQNCFIGMDTTKLFKIFGKKYNSDLYQDGKWRIHYAVSAVNVNVYEYHLTLDFVINKGIVSFVYYTEFGPIRTFD